MQITPSSQDIEQPHIISVGVLAISIKTVILYEVGINKTLTLECHCSSWSGHSDVCLLLFLLLHL